MISTYNSDLKAVLSIDIDEEHNQKVRHIRHNQEYWQSEQDDPLLTASDYLYEMAEILRIPEDQLKNLNKEVSYLEPLKQGIEYQLSEKKHIFDSFTVGYSQTFLNVPIWRSGLTVKIKQDPNRVVGAMDNSESDIHGTLPDENSIEQYRNIFNAVVARKALDDAGLGEDELASFIREVLKANLPRKTAESEAAMIEAHTQLLSGRFFIYKYNPDRRYGSKPKPDDQKSKHGISGGELEFPIPELLPVADSIEQGQAYLVAEMIFTSELPGFNGLVWLILIEIETNSILYIECMSSGVDGKVFKFDPVVKLGDIDITASDGNAVLNAHRDDVELTDLGPLDEEGKQHLSGTYVEITELIDSHSHAHLPGSHSHPLANPDVLPPTEPNGTDFDYEVRTNHFGAVNAYYHLTKLFKTIENLGFPIATYFDGTEFPIKVDHRALGALWQPNGIGGTEHLFYGLMDTTNTTNPLLRAVDPWVHWHEMAGHGSLGDHVNSSNFGFAHSAGDGLAAIQIDPESQLRGSSERFRYAPFRPFTTSERRFDRPVATWAWGGNKDDYYTWSITEYGAEQILATCHFRIYQSIGGDHDNLGRRQFASRMVTYLILRAIENLTPGTNPSNYNTTIMEDVRGRGAQLWCQKLQDTDSLNWTAEGLSGGVYNKVIRWAFEKQGSFQAASATTPYEDVGEPPEVDVYIEDGRAGEYQFQAVHWHNMSIWNRNAANGLTSHQNAIESATNFMYGKVKNRGTLTANNVTVRCFHCLPGAGLTWPVDFEEMNPIGGLTIPSIAPNSSEAVTVGPFEWEPNVNVYGHDCVLMITSVDGDPSNIDNFTTPETIEEWRLVPNDNNIGQRNVSIVPGGGGSEPLTAALDGAPFIAGNSFNQTADMELRVKMPNVLGSKGWRLSFANIENNKFRLESGEKRKLTLRLSEGSNFTADEIENVADQNITVSLYGNGVLLGGMTYHVDPELKEPSGGIRR